MSLLCLQSGIPRVLWGMDLKGWISLSFVDLNFIPFLATKDNENLLV